MSKKKQKGVEPRSERADRRKGAKDGTESERRRPKGSKHDVCDRRASTPVGANNKTKMKDIFLDVFFLCLKKQKESNREASAPTGEKVPKMAPNNLAKA